MDLDLTDLRLERNLFPFSSRNNLRHRLALTVNLADPHPQDHRHRVKFMLLDLVGREDRHPWPEDSSRLQGLRNQESSLQVPADLSLHHRSQLHQLPKRLSILPATEAISLTMQRLHTQS